MEPPTSQKEELIDLGISIRKIMDRLSAWTDKQANKLKKQGIALTHARMYSEDSSSRGEDRNIEITH